MELDINNVSADINNQKITSLRELQFQDNDVASNLLRI